MRSLSQETGGEAYFPLQIFELKGIYASIAQELRVARSEAEERAEELGRVRDTLASTSDELQEKFRDAQDDYEALKERLAEERREAAASSVAGAPAPASPVSGV